jgi:hypothetical protein
VRVSGRERSFSVTAATFFTNGSRPRSQGIWSLAAALFPLLAVRFLSPPSFFFPRFGTPRGRLWQWLRVWERRKGKAKACQSCQRPKGSKPFKVLTYASPVS